MKRERAIKILYQTAVWRQDGDVTRFMRTREIAEMQKHADSMMNVNTTTRVTVKEALMDIAK